MSPCLFCDIATGKIPCTEVYSDENLLAFRDIDPKAPIHVLVIPRRHISGLNDLQSEDLQLLGQMQLAAAEIARQEGIAEEGYRFVINCGEDGGQTVDHLHLHLLGGRSMEWPPG